MQSIFVAVGFMSALGLMLASILVLANKRLFVFEDPRIDQVEDLLPKANCGACGTAGCRPFAEMLVQGQIEPAKCTVNSKDMNQVIATFLGVDLGKEEKRVARLACAGGTHVAYIRASYGGIESCRAAALVSGGGKACGDCVEVCPKDLFSLHPVSHQLWVACNNQAFGDEAEKECEVICTACGRCAQDSPEGLIEIRDNLAVVDYAKNSLASRVAIERCPTGAIVWLEKGGKAVKGRDARKVVRKEALQPELARSVARPRVAARV